MDLALDDVVGRGEQQLTHDGEASATPRLPRLRADRLLARYVRIWRELSETSVDEFRSDPRNYGSGERFLQLAIETMLNIGHRIVAAEGFDQPKTDAEV